VRIPLSCAENRGADASIVELPPSMMGSACYGNALRPLARAARWKEEHWVKSGAGRPALLFEGQFGIARQTPRVASSLGRGAPWIRLPSK